MRDYNIFRIKLIRTVESIFTTIVTIEQNLSKSRIANTIVDQNLYILLNWFKNISQKKTSTQAFAFDLDSLFTISRSLAIKSISKRFVERLENKRRIAKR